MSLGLSFEVSKAQATPVSALCLMLVDQDVPTQLLTQQHVCLPAAMLSAAGMAMNSKTPEVALVMGFVTTIEK